MSLTMQFKKYRWPVNPSEITVSYDRNLQEKVLPLKGSLLQDMGRKKRIVTGKGCFLGEDSRGSFAGWPKCLRKGERELFPCRVFLLFSRIFFSEAECPGKARGNPLLLFFHRSG